MKFFAFIMANIILIMSCIPCKDAPIVMKAKNVQSTLAMEAGHDHGETGDDCSPLCTCACCSAHPSPQSIIIALASTPEISLKHSSVYTGLLFSVSLPIWQPPQLMA